MELSIKQIEEILPQVRNLYNLTENYVNFCKIGYKNDNGMDSFMVVLQNMQAQGKECFNYKEEIFVQQFNGGVKLINSFADYMDWHYPKFIADELNMLVQGEIFSSEEEKKEEDDNDDEENNKDLSELKPWDLSKIKVGDSIFTAINGWEKVIIINPNANYPIETINGFYNYSGKKLGFDKHHSAFTVDIFEIFKF